MNNFPYTPKMERAKRRRELRQWINKTLTPERLLNAILVGFFIFLVLIYIFAPWRG